MTISMAPEELEANASAIQGAADLFRSEFNRVRSQVESATWEGAAAMAFRESFADAGTHIDQMFGEIGAIADLLRRAKDGLDQADQEIARGLAAN